MSRKRTVDEFIAQDIENTLNQTKKKLQDIFEVSRKFEAEETDEENRVDWLPLMKDVLDIYKNRHKKKLAASHLIPVWKMYTNEYMETTKIGGDRRLQDLYDQLNWFDGKYQRSTQQMDFHKAFVASCLRNIYRDEFSANYLRILQENELREARQEVFICCPRRFGKTFAVGLFVASYLLTQPEQRICIFSPSRRQSKMMLDLIAKFVKDTERGPDMIIKMNQEELWLRGDQGANDIRILNSYPSRVSVSVSLRFSPPNNCF